MLNFQDAVLNKIVVHSVGSKHENEDITLSKSEFEINDESLQSLLQNYFFKPFKTDEFYSFKEDAGKVKEFVSAVFDDIGKFYVQSANIANRLYEVSIRPNIKKGEVYVVYFSNCVVDDEMVDAVGIFKSENKDTYLRVFQKNDCLGVHCDTGININKLDKGCLIFNTEQELGYKIAVVDNTNKTGEALYWVEEFLEVRQRENNFYKTKTVMQICKEFSDTILTEDNNVEKKEKIEFLTKSIDYFKDNEVFDIEDFNDKVIHNPQVVEAFKDFKAEYEEAMEIEPVESFDISNKAVKSNNKYFKSIIKLDKNFHIYVHSKPEMLEKGYDDEKRMKFYKLYYESED